MGRVVTQGKYVVWVYVEGGERHHLPHCHVEWPDGSCVISLLTLNVLSGKADKKARELVRSHHGQIMATWNDLVKEG